MADEVYDGAEQGASTESIDLQSLVEEHNADVLRHEMVIPAEYERAAGVEQGRGAARRTIRGGTPAPRDRAPARPQRVRLTARYTFP